MGLAPPKQQRPAMFSKQKRREKRIHLIYYLLVFDRKTDILVGHVVDITTEGMKLMSKAPLKPDTMYHFRMLLPDEMGGTKQISFDAKSMWCKDNLYSDFYGTGFRFEKISGTDIAIIGNLIDKFGH
jgi:hypothetical protein